MSNDIDDVIQFTERMTIRLTPKQKQNWDTNLIRRFLDNRFKPIEWNIVKYCDCLDIWNGMYSIPNNMFELCITDPPYNVNFQGEFNEIEFKDKFDKKSYRNWCKKWFTELCRISEGIIIFPGKPNQSMWCKIKEPKDIIYHYKPNCQGPSSVAWKTKAEPLLCYGIFKKRLNTDVIKENVKMGKNRELRNGIHPTPKPLKVIYRILQELEPKTVIDPFIGSGTTAEACTKLGIKWFGYEINPIYKQDIEKRLQGLSKEPQQSNLDEFAQQKRNTIETVILSKEDKRKEVVDGFRCNKCNFKNALIKKNNKSDIGVFECPECGDSEKVVIFYDNHSSNLAYYDKRHLNKGGGLNL